MTRTKNNPKLSHDQWLLVQKEQIEMITKLQEDKDELKRRVKELEEALKKNEEVKEENEKMKKKVFGADKHFHFYIMIDGKAS